MAEDWVKLHRELLKGKWRKVPKATRFVLMMMALEARPKDGWFELPWGTKDPIAELVDMFSDGGRKDRRETREAVLFLTSPEVASVVIVHGTEPPTIQIPQFATWNRTSNSTKRMRAKRERDRAAKKKRAVTPKCDVTGDGHGDAPDKIRGDQITPLGGEPAQLTLEGEEPKPTPKPKREKPVQIAWRVWRRLYGAKHDAQYVQADGDGQAMQRLAKNAVGHAKGRDGDPDEVTEAVLAHWFAAYLADDGFNGYLAAERHPLRSASRDLNKYGLPWSAPPKAATGTNRPELQPKRSTGGAP